MSGSEESAGDGRRKGGEWMGREEERRGMDGNGGGLRGMLEWDGSPKKKCVHAGMK